MMHNVKLTGMVQANLLILIKQECMVQVILTRLDQYLL